MFGDIDNTQNVSLDGSPSARKRVLYSVRDIPEQRMQVGTVTVDYGRVAVWRPYDPNDLQANAKWRHGTWRNIYRIRVPHDQPGSRPGTVFYSLGPVVCDGVSAVLPKSELILSHAIKSHLEAL